MLPLSELQALLGAELTPLAGFLRDVRFDTDAIAEVLALDAAPHELVTNTAYCSLVHYDPELCESSALAAVATLFVLSGWISEGAFERHVPGPVRELLVRRRLVQRAGEGWVRACVSLVPHAERFFFGDRLLERSPDGISLTQSASDHVDPPNYSSFSLRQKALGTLPDRGKSLLDVGSGTGFHGVLLSERFESTLGIDVTERCLAYSHLNARWNGARVEHERADVLSFEHEPFDAIVFNSPTVPRYKDTLDKIDTYDPPGGHLVLRFLRQRARALLVPDGVCVIWTVFRVPKSRPGVRELLVDELGAESGLDVQVLVESRSPFRLGPEEIQKGKVPRGSFLLAEPGDGPALLEYVARSETMQIAPAVVIARHASGSGSVQVEQFDPGLVAE
jgi:2-polyprenyl-3-methyl-5-hydroxy-6-metoxy-1,4-benzoquinol methylase